MRGQGAHPADQGLTDQDLKKRFALAVRWNPDEGWLEIKLPAPLAPLANRPHGRYRLTCPVQFPYRGDEVAAQAATGAIRYDISHDPARDRWYLDASSSAHGRSRRCGIL